MEPLSIAVCEDEADAFSRLLSLMGRCGIPHRVERFEDGTAFLSSFHPGRYDLILMDIYMDGMGGLEAVAKLRERDEAVPVAFITTSGEHAMDGYRYHVCRYLQKPVREEDVAEVMELALREKENRPGLTLSVRDGAKHIPFAQIRYIEQRDHELIFCLTGQRSLTLRGRLDRFEQLLPKPPFYRCHKSYLVNLSYVRRLDREVNIFEMTEGGAAYIRRDSVREAARSLERFLFEEARKHW